MNTAPTLYSVIHWIDLLWIPVALLTMERGKRLLTLGFVASCSVLLRLQVELMQAIGYPNGIFGWAHSDIFFRGLIAYGVFELVFLILAYFSQGSDKSVHMAASISILIVAFCVSALVMVL